MEYLILIILGFIAGTIGSLVGLGGGIVIAGRHHIHRAFFNDCVYEV